MLPKLRDLIWVKPAFVANAFFGGPGKIPILKIVEIRGSGPHDLQYTAVPVFPTPLDSISSIMLSRKQFWIFKRFAASFGAAYGEGDIVQHNGTMSASGAGVYCLVKGVLIEEDRSITGYLVERLNFDLPLLHASQDSLKLVQRAADQKPEASTELPSIKVSTSIDPDLLNSFSAFFGSPRVMKTDLCTIKEFLKLNMEILPREGLETIRTGIVRSSDTETVITYNPEEVKTAIFQHGNKAELTITRKKKDA